MFIRCLRFSIQKTLLVESLSCLMCVHIHMRIKMAQLPNVYPFRKIIKFKTNLNIKIASGVPFMLTYQTKHKIVSHHAIFCSAFLA